MSPSRTDTWSQPQHVIRLNPADATAFRARLVDATRAHEDLSKQVVGSVLLRALTRGKITESQVRAWYDEFGPWKPAGEVAAAQPKEIIRLNRDDDAAFQHYLIDLRIRARLSKQVAGSTVFRAWTRGKITDAQVLDWSAEFGPWLPD
ncbi:hypothetical protein [Nocardia wallacei]|uniref:hypothetical protein n=1 Tax=Nocardia wallacei TaxID=480035 RepID=UPI0024565E19|nr:hypothetical protein [Nocardia wallacei]